MKSESSWGKLDMKFKNVCRVINGRAYKLDELLEKGKYPVLRVGNFFTNSEMLYSDLELESDKYCEDDDLLFAWSASFGPKIYRGPKSIYHYHIWKLQVDDSKADKYYLYYWLLNNVRRMQAGGHGSVMAHITKQDMENQEIDLPPLQLQKRIAGILKSLDEKMDNNAQINKNLLEQVLTLYRKRFVDTLNNERRICSADEYFDISIGKTPPRKEHQWFSTNPHDVNWVSISDMGACGLYICNSSEQLTREAIDRYKIKIVPDNTVILSFKLTVGRVAITNGEMVTNEAIAHFKTDKKEINEYLYCYLKCFNYQTMGSTSSIATAVNSKTIKTMPFVVPTDDELMNFHNVAAPMFATIKANQIENQYLASVRDMLLPKLMSGKLNVTGTEL